MSTQQNPGCGIRLLLGLVAAVAVSGTAYFCAWSVERGDGYFLDLQQMTKEGLRILQQDIERFRQANGRLPVTLADLDVLKTQPGWWEVEDGQVLDLWHHPLQYRVEKDSYTLFSFGEDGKLGGVGWDADLYAGEGPQPRELLTLWQFTTTEGVRGIQVTCLLAGLFAFVLCLTQSGDGKGARRSLRNLVVRNILTMVFCLLAALVICIVHIPNGH